MNREQEDKIIKQVQDILERRIATEMNIKINLHNIVYYGAYLLGALMAAEKLIPYVMQNYRGDDKVYIKAELDTITSSKRDKKGKLESCECYFVENRNVITEVK